MIDSEPPQFRCHAPGCGSGRDGKWHGTLPFCPLHMRMLKDAGAVTWSFGHPRVANIHSALESAVPRGEIWTQLVRAAQEWLKTKDADMGRQQELFHGDP